MADALFDLKKTLLVTGRVMAEEELNLQIEIDVQQSRINIETQVHNALDLIEVSTRSNKIPTVLNTNYIMGIGSTNGFQTYTWLGYYTLWYSTLDPNETSCRCQQMTCSFPAVFESRENRDNMTVYAEFRIDLENVTENFPGFAVSCTPLEAILQAKLICLYYLECLRVLLPYFPNLRQVKSISETINFHRSLP